MFGLYSYIKHNGPDPEYYSCKNHSIEYWYSHGRKRPFFAVYFYISATILIAIYVACLVAMIKSRLFFKVSCYKIMLTMGFFDIASIVVNSYITGYLCYVGGVFCTHPHLIYITGSIGVGLWSGSCVLVVLLALNRFCELSKNIVYTLAFQGNRTFLLLPLAFIWMSIMTAVTPAGMFTSNQLAWFFDPFNESGKNYTNLPHTFNNCIVAVLASVGYVKICLKMAQKSSFSKEAFSKVQRQLFLQSTLICSFHAVASYGYVVMNFWAGFPAELIQVGHVAWQWSNGSPGVIYFFMNKKLKATIYSMFGLKIRAASIYATSTALNKQSEYSKSGH